MVESSAPRVTLRNYFSRPYDSAIAAARTCYSPTLITPDQITDKQRVTIGAATFEGGHHTVYQHAHFEFGRIGPRLSPASCLPRAAPPRSPCRGGPGVALHVPGRHTPAAR